MNFIKQGNSIGIAGLILFFLSFELGDEFGILEDLYTLLFSAFITIKIVNQAIEELKKEEKKAKSE